MYCKMYVIASGAILKKINICKSLVELYSAILVRFSIFSLQLELIVPVPVQQSEHQGRWGLLLTDDWRSGAFVDFDTGISQFQVQFMWLSRTFEL